MTWRDGQNHDNFTHCECFSPNSLSGGKLKKKTAHVYEIPPQDYYLSIFSEILSEESPDRGGNLQSAMLADDIPHNTLY